MLFRDKDLEVLPAETLPNLLLIAPHGYHKKKPKDDEYTAEIARGISKKLGCHAIINDTIQRDILNFNSIEEAEKHKTFIPKIKEIIEANDHTLVVWIHGADDTSVDEEAKHIKKTSEELDALIGYGQKQDQKTTGNTAETKTVEKLAECLTKQRMKTVISSLKFRGREPDNMNRWFRLKGKYPLKKVESIQIEIRQRGFRKKNCYLNTVEIIVDALAEMISSKYNQEVAIVLDKDDKLVNEAYKKLKEIFGAHFHDAMIEAGDHIIKTFYNNDPYLALAKNKAEDQPIGVIKLRNKINRSSGKPDEKPPSVGWFYNAINLAAHEAISKKMRLQTFGSLGHSHKLELLHTPELKSVKGEEIKKAIEPAFKVKEALAKVAVDKNLSVRDFKKHIKEYKIKEGKKKPPNKEPLNDEINFSIPELRKLDNPELLNRLSGVEEIMTGSKAWLKAQNGPFRKQLHEIDTRQKMLRKGRVARYNLELVLTEKGEKFPQNRGRFHDWIDPGNNVNIFKGCENDCYYCYAKPGIGKWCRVSEGKWHLMELNPNQYEVEPKMYDGMVGFPSTHDIVPEPEKLDACLTMLGKLLRAGNDVLIVSKPHPECIERICQAAQFFRDKILFRFTIGAMDDKILSVCEPNAPTYAQRKESLEVARDYEFETSVSMEPMLDINNVEALIEDLRSLVTEVIWLGTINHKTKIENTSKRAFDRAEKANDEAKVNEIEAFQKEFARIKKQQTTEKLAALYKHYEKDAQVMWKGDAVKELSRYWEANRKAPERKSAERKSAQNKIFEKK